MITKVMLASPEQTQRLAALLGQAADPGTVVLLQGNLGSGKTTFVQGIGQGLGIPGVINSPTFVMVQEYWEGRIPLFHADLYRLPKGGATDLGLEELWAGSGLTVIEWPERLAERPAEWLELTLQIVNDSARWLEVNWQGDHHGQVWGRTVRGWTEGD